MTNDALAFPDWADAHVPLSGADEAYFGRDVLQGLVDGIDQAARAQTTDRRWGAAVLGCSLWMDDPDLIAVLRQMANVCVVVTKQERRKYKSEAFQALAAFAQDKGLAHEAYPELHEFAVPREGGPLEVGPGTPPWWEDQGIPAVREAGFRKSGNRLVPIVHAKIALLGHMIWTDEHPSGYPVDELHFIPDRLWIGSANFTRASRSSLEMGVWLSDKQLMDAARRFLLALISLSEPLGQGPDHLEPELQPVEYDDEAFLEYLHEVRGLSVDSAD